MSAKELNIGDYVRTKHYGICSVIDIYNEELIELNKINAFGIKGVSYSIENIIKSSSNIIDLIEEGDILEVKDMLGNISKVEVDENFKLLTGRIVAITTHEQYEANKFKIGE